MNCLSFSSYGFLVFQVLLLFLTLSLHGGNRVLVSRRVCYLRVCSVLCIILSLFFPLFAVEGIGILMVMFHFKLIRHFKEYGNENYDHGKGNNYIRLRKFYLVFSLFFFLGEAMLKWGDIVSSREGGFLEKLTKCSVFSSKMNAEIITKPEKSGHEAVKTTSPSVAFETNGLARAMRMARLSVDSMYGEGSFDKGFEDMRMDRMLRKLKMNVRLNADTNLTLDVSLVSPVPRVYLTTNSSLCD